MVDVPPLNEEAEDNSPDQCRKPTMAFVVGVPRKPADIANYADLYDDRRSDAGNSHGIDEGRSIHGVLAIRSPMPFRGLDSTLYIGAAPGAMLICSPRNGVP